MNIKIIKDNKLINVQVFDSIEQAQQGYPDCELVDVSLSYEEYCEQIDDFIASKIRERYSANDEYKMLRLGALDSSNQDFIDYNTYVEECINWGKSEKAKYHIGSGD